MTRAPKIGQRVRYSGRLGPCTGTVEHIYRTYDYPEDSDDWTDLQLARAGTLKPESQWKVRVRVDTVPKDWPYTGSDKFAPAVADLEPLEEVRP